MGKRERERETQRERADGSTGLELNLFLTWKTEEGGGGWAYKAKAVATWAWGSCMFPRPGHSLWAAQRRPMPGTQSPVFFTRHLPSTGGDIFHLSNYFFMTNTCVYIVP